PASSPTSYYKQKTKVFKGSSAMPQSTRKRLRGVALLRLSRLMLESGQNFDRTKILPKLSTNKKSIYRNPPKPKA
ncbi:MAG: hypothetical protein Q7S42_05350, partial [Candidatus Omnitrophota bacterium]|nr:hypothetical protein [Candidatus Omnitrophota bacterium]